MKNARSGHPEPQATSRRRFMCLAGGSTVAGAFAAACDPSASPRIGRGAGPEAGVAGEADVVMPPATALATTPAETPALAAPAAPARPGVDGTRVRFTAGDAEIVVRTADNPTSRDFVSMLPLTLEFSDFARMEKLSYLPRRLTTQGSTGSPPANRDLIYYVPWGNLGFFYDAARRDRSHDDRVIPIGTVETGYEHLNRLETGPVRVERLP